MNIEEILSIFNSMSGTDAEGLSFCEQAMHELESGLKASEPEDCDCARLNNAAAILAYYRYLLLVSSNDSVDSFSAGDIRVKHTAAGRLLSAARLKEEAMNSICGLLRDRNFMFMGVGVQETGESEI